MKIILPKNLKAVFLDFDGVVLESADIKTQAFYDLYLPYGPIIAEKAKQYHIVHQGVSRAKKFVEIHRQYLNKACNNEEINTLSNKFSDIVFQKIIDCKLVDGILSFLEKMCNIEIPVFLLSATPHDELIDICEKRGLNKFFNKIYGAPHDKKITGTKLLEELNLNQNDVLFVGDSISDFQAAAGIGVTFIGRVGKDMQNPFSDQIKIIENFNDILSC